MDISTVSNYMSESLTQKKAVLTEKSEAAHKTEDSKKAASDKEVKQEAAAVVEKSQEEQKVTYSKKAGKVDYDTIQKLKQEAEDRTAQLRSLVEKLLLKQGKTFDDSMDMYQLIREGKLEVDEETRLQAQKDIAEDGYWGVEQTSERLFSFAKALAANDPEQAEKMTEAFERGFEEAKKQWGGELPEICNQTREAFLKKMDDWKKGNDSSTEGKTEVK